MTMKSPAMATVEQRRQLQALAGSKERGEADRARAILLTLEGWTSAEIGEAFAVREDTVRLVLPALTPRRTANTHGRRDNGGPSAA